jgi:HK97 family phage prohead protease
MTETEIETTLPADRVTLARSFESVDIEADGRNVFLRCVPYDTRAQVSDPPSYLPYEEEFARGAFASAARAPNRTLLEFEHFHPGLSGILGHGVELEEKDDALYGRFRVTKHPDGDKALELIHEGVLRAASVFFDPIKTARTAEGVLRRLKVRLDRVALCRVGSYPTAEVLAVRSGIVTVDDDEEDDTPPVVTASTLPFDPDLARDLAERGIRVPDRLRSAD